MTNQNIQGIIVGLPERQFDQDELDQFLGLIQQDGYAEQFKEAIQQEMEKKSF